MPAWKPQHALAPGFNRTHRAQAVRSRVVARATRAGKRFAGKMTIFLYLLGAVAVFGVAMFLLAGANKLLAMTAFKFQATFKGSEKDGEGLEERPRRRLYGRRDGRARNN